MIYQNFNIILHQQGRNRGRGNPLKDSFSLVFVLKQYSFVFVLFCFVLVWFLFGRGEGGCGEEVGRKATDFSLSYLTVANRNCLADSLLDFSNHSGVCYIIPKWLVPLQYYLVHEIEQCRKTSSFTMKKKVWGYKLSLL